MNPSRITVHCSASRKGRYLTAFELRKFHTDPPPLGRGWSDLGYHFVIRTDGVVDTGRSIDKQGAHVKGHNSNNIGICLIGGLDRSGKPANTYSHAQFHALYALIRELCAKYKIPFTEVCGHRDYSPDLNGDGQITTNEFIKDCPCFDVVEWLGELLEQDGVDYGLV